MAHASTPESRLGRSKVRFSGQLSALHRSPENVHPAPARRRVANRTTRSGLSDSRQLGATSPVNGMRSEAGNVYLQNLDAVRDLARSHPEQARGACLYPTGALKGREHTLPLVDGGIPKICNRGR
jgi:hypothetical protein